MLGELARCGLEDFAQVAGLEAHPHPIDLGPRLAEHVQAFVVVANVQAHFCQDAVGGCLDF